LKIKYPLILINFKTYEESRGKRSLVLAKVAEKIGKEYDVCMAVAPQYVDISLIANNTSVPVFSQHVDPEMPGSYTGHVTPESVKEAGACGSIINHSEHRLRADVIENTVDRCRSLGIITCVCANTSTMGKVLSALSPDMIAVEPPELIGSGVSVSRAQPEIITNSVRMIKAVNLKVHVLCGAGVTKGEDVRMALKLGSEGILVASGVVKAKDPAAILREFAECTRNP
jgi:triosephosphate isomerase